MTCEITSEQVSSYYDGELLGAARVKMELHIAACVECQKQLATYRAMSSAISCELRTLEAPSWIEQMVLATIGERLDTYQAVRMKWGTLLVALLMAASVIAIAVSPIGRLVWSVLRMLMHGGRTVFRTLPNLPFGAGTGLFSSSFVVICFGFSIVCAIVLLGLSRRWRTA